MAEEEKVIETLKKIVLDASKTITEREEVIDALSVFGEKAVPALAEIADKADSIFLRERAIARLKEIKKKK